MGGSSKNAIPLLIGAASLLLFIGILVCLGFIDFYSSFSHGGQYVGVVTLPRAAKYYSSAILCFDKTLQSSATLRCKTQEDDADQRNPELQSTIRLLAVLLTSSCCDQGLVVSC